MNFYQITSKSLSELGVQTFKDLWGKVEGEYRGLATTLSVEFTQKAENENKFSVVMSTATEDRHGDIVLQNWDLKSFKKNPVLLDSHNYGSIEHIIGRVNKPKVVEGKLVGEIEFNLDNPKGLLAYNMAQKGFLNATSVGFIPKSFNEKGDIAESELLELSAVSVPANAEALFERAIKSISEETETLDEVVNEEVEDIVEDIEDEEIEIKALQPTLLQKTVRSMKEDMEAKEERRKRLIKQVTNLMEEVASGRSSNKTKINKAVKKLLEIKKIY